MNGIRPVRPVPRVCLKSPALLPCAYGEDLIVLNDLVDQGIIRAYAMGAP